MTSVLKVTNLLGLIRLNAELPLKKIYLILKLKIVVE